MPATPHDRNLRPLNSVEFATLQDWVDTRDPHAALPQWAEIWDPAIVKLHRRRLLYGVETPSAKTASDTARQHARINRRHRAASILNGSNLLKALVTGLVLGGLASAATAAVYLVH